MKYWNICLAKRVCGSSKCVWISVAPLRMCDCFVHESLLKKIFEETLKSTILLVSQVKGNTLKSQINLKKQFVKTFCKINFWKYFQCTSLIFALQTLTISWNAWRLDILKLGIILEIGGCMTTCAKYNSSIMVTAIVSWECESILATVVLLKYHCVSLRDYRLN